MYDRKCMHNRVLRTLCWNTSGTCFRDAEEKQLQLWSVFQFKFIYIHTIQRHLWALLSFHALYIAIKSPLSRLTQHEDGSTWDRDRPPHVLMLPLNAGRGRQPQHAFQTRWWEEISHSHADGGGGGTHKAFHNLPHSVVVSARGTFICLL